MYLILFTPTLSSLSVSWCPAAFATGVPPDIYAFHRYTGDFFYLLHYSRKTVLKQFAG